MIVSGLRPARSEKQKFFSDLSSPRPSRFEEQQVRQNLFFSCAHTACLEEHVMCSSLPARFEEHQVPQNGSAVINVQNWTGEVIQKNIEMLLESPWTEDGQNLIGEVPQMDTQIIHKSPWSGGGQLLFIKDCYTRFNPQFTSYSIEDEAAYMKKRFTKLKLENKTHFVSYINGLSKLPKQLALSCSIHPPPSRVDLIQAQVFAVYLQGIGNADFLQGFVGSMTRRDLSRIKHYNCFRSSIVHPLRQTVDGK